MDFKFLSNNEEKSSMNLSKAKARKMLQEMSDIAVNASMTESLMRGARMLMVNYNKIRDTAIKNGWIDGDLIAEFNKDEYVDENDNWEDATIMDAIGISVKLLLSQLEDDDSENV